MYGGGDEGERYTGSGPGQGGGPACALVGCVQVQGACHSRTAAPCSGARQRALCVYGQQQQACMHACMHACCQVAADARGLGHPLGKRETGSALLACAPAKAGHPSPRRTGHGPRNAHAAVTEWSPRWPLPCVCTCTCMPQAELERQKESVLMVSGRAGRRVVGGPVAPADPRCLGTRAFSQR